VRNIAKKDRAVAIEELKKMVAAKNNILSALAPFVSKPGADVSFDKIQNAFPADYKRWIVEWDTRREEPATMGIQDWCYVVSSLLLADNVRSNKPEYCGSNALTALFYKGDTPEQKQKCRDYELSSKWVDAAMDRLKTAFGYTQSEAEVLKMLKSGSSGLLSTETYGQIWDYLLQEILLAKSNGISLNTIQQQAFWRSSKSECAFRILREKFRGTNPEFAIAESMRQDLTDIQKASDPHLGAWGTGRSLTEMAYQHTTGTLMQTDEKKSATALMKLPA